MGTIENIDKVQNMLNMVETAVLKGDFEIVGQLFLLEKGVLKHKFTFE